MEKSSWGVPVGRVIRTVSTSSVDPSPSRPRPRADRRPHDVLVTLRKGSVGQHVEAADTAVAPVAAYKSTGPRGTSSLAPICDLGGSS